jgi:hypothetical protein
MNIRLMIQTYLLKTHEKTTNIRGEVQTSTIYSTPNAYAPPP